jgi:hypothetical protein
LEFCEIQVYNNNVPPQFLTIILIILFSDSCTNNLKCINNKCDPNTQKCKEPNDPKNDGICVCKDGFVNITNGNSHTCVEFDPCNQKHRNASGDFSSACEEPRICIVIESKKKAFSCVCPDGYMETKGLLIHSHLYNK